MEIHMHDLAAERVMLDFLNQRQAPGLVEIEIHEDVLGGGVVDEIIQFARDEFQIFRLGGELAVDDGGHATGFAKFLVSAATRLRAGFGIQWH
jgi:hypothetical protein